MGHASGDGGVESGLGLRHTHWGRWDVGEVELAEVVVVLGHDPLNQGGHHTLVGLDSKGQRCHVEQEQVGGGIGGVFGQDGGLNGGTV